MEEPKDYFDALSDMSKWLKINTEKDKHTFNAAEIQKAINDLYDPELDELKKN